MQTQFYKFVCVKLFTLSLLAMYPPCWLFRWSSPQRLLWLRTSHQLLWGMSTSVTCLKSTAPAPQLAEAHKVFMMPTQTLSGWMCLTEECLWPSLSFSKDLPKLKEMPHPFFLRKNVLHCTWSECTWSKIVSWNLVFIQVNGLEAKLFDEI